MTCAGHGGLQEHGALQNWREKGCPPEEPLKVGTETGLRTASRRRRGGGPRPARAGKRHGRRGHRTRPPARLWACVAECPRACSARPFGRRWTEGRLQPGSDGGRRAYSFLLGWWSVICRRARAGGRGECGERGRRWARVTRTAPPTHHFHWRVLLSRSGMGVRFLGNLRRHRAARAGRAREGRERARARAGRAGTGRGAAV